MTVGKLLALAGMAGECLRLATFFRATSLVTHDVQTIVGPNTGTTVTTTNRHAPRGARHQRRLEVPPNGTVLAHGNAVEMTTSGNRMKRPLPDMAVRTEIDDCSEKRRQKYNVIMTGGGQMSCHKRNGPNQSGRGRKCRLRQAQPVSPRANLSRVVNPVKMSGQRVYNQVKKMNVCTGMVMLTSIRGSASAEIGKRSITTSATGLAKFRCLS